jgi:hypothetical protein
MNDSLTSSFNLRRYRLAQVVVVFGSFAIGLLILAQLWDLLHDDIYSYYGAADIDSVVQQQSLEAKLPFTLTQVAIAFSAFIGIFWFIGSERRRVRESTTIDNVCRDRCSHLVVERPSAMAIFDEIVLRTSAFSGLLLAGWLLQTSLLRRLVGLGWGIEYADWRSLLPIVSVFGLSVLVGLFVACFSVVGLRAITVLELVLTRMGVRRRHAVARLRARRVFVNIAPRTIRDRIGCDILSRPPPVRRANALAFAS